MMGAVAAAARAGGGAHRRRHPAGAGRLRGGRHRRRRAGRRRDHARAQTASWTSAPTGSSCCPAGSARSRRCSRSGRRARSACTPNRSSSSTRPGTTRACGPLLNGWIDGGFVRAAAWAKLPITAELDEAVDLVTAGAATANVTGLRADVKRLTHVRADRLRPAGPGGRGRRRQPARPRPAGRPPGPAPSRRRPVRPAGARRRSAARTWPGFGSR